MIIRPNKPKKKEPFLEKQQKKFIHLESELNNSEVDSENESDDLYDLRNPEIGKVLSTPNSNMQEPYSTPKTSIYAVKEITPQKIKFSSIQPKTKIQGMDDLLKKFQYPINANNVNQRQTSLYPEMDLPPSLKAQERLKKYSNFDFVSGKNKTPKNDDLIGSTNAYFSKFSN